MPHFESTLATYIGILGVACIIGILVKWRTSLPYTIALTLTGLGFAFLDFGPDIHRIGFGKEMIFSLLLPPLLF